MHHSALTAGNLAGLFSGRIEADDKVYVVIDNHYSGGLDKSTMPLDTMLTSFSGGPYILIETRQRYAIVVTEPAPAAQEVLVLF